MSYRFIGFPHAVVLAQAMLTQFAVTVNYGPTPILLPKMGREKTMLSLMRPRRIHTSLALFGVAVNVGLFLKPWWAIKWNAIPRL
jgi:hypothetical protein